MAKKDEPKALTLPTVEDIMKAEDCSEMVAGKILAGLQALVRERSFRDLAKKRKDSKHYICRPVRAHGYWRIGRKFEPGDSVVFFDELTAAQVVELEETDPANMKVVKVGFGDEKKKATKSEPNPEPTPDQTNEDSTGG